MRFWAVRKWLFSIWKIAQITARTTKTRKEARSPWTKRRSTSSHAGGLTSSGRGAAACSGVELIAHLPFRCRPSPLAPWRP